MASSATAEEQNFEQKVSQSIAKTFLRADDTLDQKDINVSQVGKVTLQN